MELTVGGFRTQHIVKNLKQCGKWKIISGLKTKRLMVGTEKSTSKQTASIDISNISVG